MFAKRCAVLLAVTLASAGTTLRAEEINWRTSYNAVRDEAAAKKLPIVIEITADFCTWCRKLESTTLSDPTVVNIVNKNFVPFKLHRDQYGWLAEALNVKGYPTMVLASPTGKIVVVQEGYVDASTFQRQLEQVLTPPATTANAQAIQDPALRPASVEVTP